MDKRLFFIINLQFRQKLLYGLKTFIWINQKRFFDLNFFLKKSFFLI